MKSRNLFTAALAVAMIGGVVLIPAGALAQRSGRDYSRGRNSRSDSSRYSSRSDSNRYSQRQRNDSSQWSQRRSDDDGWRNSTRTTTPWWDQSQNRNNDRWQDSRNRRNGDGDRDDWNRRDRDDWDRRDRDDDRWQDNRNWRDPDHDGDNDRRRRSYRYNYNYYQPNYYYVPSYSYGYGGGYGYNDSCDWRTIADAAGLLAVIGLLDHDNTLVFVGTFGALYSLDRYDHDRYSDDPECRLRAAYFSHPYFIRNGRRYDRELIDRDGEQFYRFVCR